MSSISKLNVMFNTKLIRYTLPVRNTVLQSFIKEDFGRYICNARFLHHNITSSKSYNNNPTFTSCSGGINVLPWRTSLFPRSFPLSPSTAQHSQMKLLKTLPENSCRNDKSTPYNATEPVLTKENPVTIPNILTMSRICMTPLLCYLIIQHSYPTACGVFILAGATDCADGYIARNFAGQATTFGSFLDPLADKILISAVFISLSCVQLIPLPLTVIVIGRDIGLIVAAFWVRYISMTPPVTLRKFFDVTMPNAQLKPMFLGKVNLNLQLFLVASTLAAPVFGYIDHVALQCLWYVTAASTLATAAEYYIHKEKYYTLNTKK